MTTTATKAIRCNSCKNQGRRTTATHARRYEIVGQDADIYVPLCDDHADERAPMVPLAEVEW